jgi:GNAT superfamily N-acetyltransferase
MTFLPAQTFSLAALTEVWNRGYAGYFFPVLYSEAQLAQHIRAGSLDLGSSLIHTENGVPVAFCFLGRRGDRGWIGGVGVAPAHRKKGLARRLFAAQLEVAAPLGLASVTLEVLRQNWAKKVYAAAGFVPTRDLVMLTGRLPDNALAPPGARLATEAVFQAHHARLHRGSPACWQRELPSLVPGPTPERSEVLAVGPEASPSAMLVVGAQPGGLRIRDGAAQDEVAAAQIVAALAARHPGASLTIVNEPEHSPLHRVLAAAGLVERLAQHEMSWTGQPR